MEVLVIMLSTALVVVCVLWYHDSSPIEEDTSKEPLMCRTLSNYKEGIEGRDAIIKRLRDEKSEIFKDLEKLCKDVKEYKVLTQYADYIAVKMSEKGFKLVCILPSSENKDIIIARCQKKDDYFCQDFLFSRSFLNLQVTNKVPYVTIEVPNYLRHILFRED